MLQLQSLDKNKRYLLAFSGGPDSLAVFHLLNECGFQFDCIHINHGLSVNALKWQEFCQSVCAENNIKCLSFAVEVDKNAPSVEAEAREKRYGVISTIFKNYECWDAVITGHHINDHVETILFSIMRGGEWSSMDGIQEVGEIFGFPIIRPVISKTRSQLQQFLEFLGVTEWNVDESNDSSEYSRNYLRNEIIPLLEMKFPTFNQSLVRFAQRANYADKYKLAFMETFMTGGCCDFNELFELYTNGDAFKRDIAMSVVHYAAKTRSKTILSKAQLEQFCVELFTFKHGKTPNKKDFIKGGVLCKRCYNSDKKLILSFSLCPPLMAEKQH